MVEMVIELISIALIFVGAYIYDTTSYQTLGVVMMIFFILFSIAGGVVIGEQKEMEES